MDKSSAHSRLVVYQTWIVYWKCHQVNFERFPVIIAPQGHCIVGNWSKMMGHISRTPWARTQLTKVGRLSNLNGLLEVSCSFASSWKIPCHHCSTRSIETALLASPQCTTAWTMLHHKKGLTRKSRETSRSDHRGHTSMTLCWQDIGI